ncbi:MAG: undecaprenyl-phosphate glucose phosphotransferase [Pikeienuella sp.]
MDAVETPETRGYARSADLVPDFVALLDAMMILAAALIPFWMIVPYHQALLEPYLFCIGFVVLAAIVMLAESGMYRLASITQPVAKSDLIIVSIISAFLFFLTIAFSLKVSELYSRIWIYTFAGVAIFLTIVGRLAVREILMQFEARRVVGRNIVVLGEGQEAARFLRTVDQKVPALTDIIGVFAARAPTERTEIAGREVLGDCGDLIAFARRHRVDAVVITMPLSADGRVDALIAQLKELPVHIYIASQLADFELRFKPALGFPDTLPLFEVVQRPISGWSALLKAVFDFIVASALIVLLAPLLILVAIAIKIDSPGPVFFMQPRLGFNNRVFRIFKFRSMYHREVPERSVTQASKDDPRVTRVGRFIRRTSIDELPQLFNVLNGTMSLVGPRPHALSHNEDYGRRIRQYFTRHKVKPGITGWAQVNNLRGETEVLSKMEARVEHDIFYAENWSLLFDLRILLMTVAVVFFQKTAY